jgi:hypothetical protein
MDRVYVNIIISHKLFKLYFVQFSLYKFVKKIYMDEKKQNAFFVNFKKLKKSVSFLWVDSNNEHDFYRQVSDFLFNKE